MRKRTLSVVGSEDILTFQIKLSRSHEIPALVGVRCRLVLARRQFVALTDHIEASGVAEEAHVVSLNFHVVVGEDTVGSVEEAE